VTSSYFFLSYAHSAPLAGSPAITPDPWVQHFYNDLSDGVRRNASRGSRLTPGFFDQEIPLGSNWNLLRDQALATAQVFVPLYSPGYLTRSLTGREWACFHDRMAQMGFSDPLRRFVPVLWTPLPGSLGTQGRDPLGLREAAPVGVADPVYAENGLQALLRLAPYRTSYQRIVGRLAALIVHIAESAPLEPSPVRNIDDVQSAFGATSHTQVFAVTVAGRDGASWRPYHPDQEMPLVGYAVTIAEQFDFTVSVRTDVGTVGGEPGILLIDPLFVADDEGLGSLRACVWNLPPWVLPLLVRYPAEGEGAARHARRVIDLLSGSSPSQSGTAGLVGTSVGSLAEFVAFLPRLVAEAERQYLRHGPVWRRGARPGARPRLTGLLTPPTKEAPHA
jgi:hypothetical protein